MKLGTNNNDDNNKQLFRWRGEGEKEEGFDKKDGRVLVKVDPRYFRPTEVEHLLGNPAKAKKGKKKNSETLED